MAEQGEGTGLLMAGMLAGLAGAVDAIAYLRLQRALVSFMSGNTMALGLSVGRADWAMAGQLAPLVGAFLAGVVAGSVIAGVSGQWHTPTVLGIVAAVLAAVAGGAGPRAVWLGLAMGVLNGAMNRAGPVRVSLTYVTGTLVRFGQGLGRWLLGHRGEDWGAQAVPWIGLAAGAAAGGWLERRLGLQALWATVGLALAVAAWAAVRRG